MFHRLLIVAAIFIPHDLTALFNSSDPSCPSAITRKSFQFSIRSVRNESGEWVSKVESRRGLDHGTHAVDVDFKHSVVECGGEQWFHLEGIFGEKVTEDRDMLRFHPKCGKNAAITNKGRTIEKLNGEERLFGVAFTNRHLRLNELFEVIVEKREGNKLGYFMGIGITTISPDDGEIPNHINALRSGTYVMYHNQVYHNGNLLQNHRKQNLDQLKVGDRVGLKVTESRTLLMSINGNEEAAASNVPFPVYGVFECYGDSTKVSLT